MMNICVCVCIYRGYDLEIHAQISERLICSILMSKGHHFIVSTVLVKKKILGAEGCLGFTSAVRNLFQPRASQTRVIWRSATKGFKSANFTNANNSRVETAKYLINKNYSIFILINVKNYIY